MAPSPGSFRRSHQSGERGHPGLGRWSHVVSVLAGQNGPVAMCQRGTALAKLRSTALLVIFVALASLWPVVESSAAATHPARTVTIGGLRFSVPTTWAVMNVPNGGETISGAQCPRQRYVITVEGSVLFHCSGASITSVGLFTQTFGFTIRQDQYTHTFTSHGVRINAWEAPVSGGNVTGWQVFSSFSGSPVKAVAQGLGPLDHAYVAQLNNVFKSVIRVRRPGKS